METKICTQCGLEKPLSEFYKHGKMADGYMAKCKDCTKENVHKNYERKINDPEYVERERARGRDKYRRLYAGRVEKNHSHIENSNTRRNLKSKGVDIEGMEVHHWDYERRMDVFILSPRAHKLAHLNLEFDKDTKKFRYKGELLDTASKHHKALEEIFDTKGYEIRYYNLWKEKN